MKKGAIILRNYNFEDFIFKNDSKISFTFYVVLNFYVWHDRKGKIEKKIINAFDVLKKFFNSLEFKVNWQWCYYVFRIDVKEPFKNSKRLSFYFGLIKETLEKIFLKEFKKWIGFSDLEVSRKIVSLANYLKNIKNDEELKREFNRQIEPFNFVFSQKFELFEFDIYYEDYLKKYSSLSLDEIFEIFPDFWFLNNTIEIKSDINSLYPFNLGNNKKEFFAIYNQWNESKLISVFGNKKYIEMFGEDRLRKAIMKDMKNYFKDLFFNFVKTSKEIFIADDLKNLKLNNDRTIYIPYE